MTTVPKDDLQRFRSAITDRLGLCFEDKELSQLSKVMTRRILETKSGGVIPYLAKIDSKSEGTKELQSVAELLVVGETYFFRHPDHFHAFAEVALPARLKARSDERRMKILSAGCATGEEPYSLAASVKDLVPDLSSWQIEIQGIDISDKALKKAVQGKYTTWSLRDLTAESKDQLFVKKGTEYILNESIRKMVSFERKNLIEKDPLFWQPGTFDIIFCRNVLIYFSPDAIRTAIAQMTQALAPGGFLFLGYAESLRGISQEFHLLHTHDVFYYQKRFENERKSEIKNSFQDLALKSEVPLELAQIDPILSVDPTWMVTIKGASERIAALARNASQNRLEPQTQDAKLNHPSSNFPLELEAARAFLKLERFDEAMRILDDLPPESAMEIDAQLLRAVLLTNQGEIAEAEKVCRRILEFDELNAGAHYLKALSHEHAGNILAAVEENQIAIYLDPEFAMPRLHMGLLAKRSGDSAKAQRELSRALFLLEREDAGRILLFGGGFNRKTLVQLCQAELRIYQAAP
jgi:chemotaxis protein methyltransferase CheR